MKLAYLYFHPYSRF